MLAGGIALVTVAGLLVYPFANADETPRMARADERSGGAFAVVAVPTLSSVSDLRVSAPPLIEPQSSPVVSVREAKPAPVATIVEAGLRNNARQAPPAVPDTISMPLRDTAVVDERERIEVAAAPVTPTAPIDSWLPLRDALAGCSRSNGIWERATCEQRARLAHCDGYWGNVALCPTGRTDFGQ